MPTRPDPGSFRDPDSRVNAHDGAAGAAGCCRTGGWRTSTRWPAAGCWTIRAWYATERLPDEEAPPDLDASAVLRHERVPFVSYPYEWTFSMLQDAALLQLDLLLAALDHDLTLKDASAYNVQFRGSRPVFIDIGSFERLREQELWAGYRQFCMQYLFPLWLHVLAEWRSSRC